MATGYALPYSGPGYPDFRETGKEMTAGLAGLARMQAAADASAQKLAGENVAELRGQRAAELKMNETLLGNSAEATGQDLQAARQYVQLRQQELVLRDAHAQVAAADRAAAEARMQDAFLEGNPTAQMLVRKLESGTAWDTLEGAVNLQRGGVLDRLPERYGQTARKVLAAAAQNNLAAPVPGSGDVPLPQIISWGDPETQATPLQRATYIATARSLGGGEDFTRRFSAAEIAAGDALVFTPDQHAELRELEKLSVAADDLFALSVDESAPADRREAARAQHEAVSATLRARAAMLGPGYEVYRSLKNGQPAFSDETRAKMAAQLVPPASPERIANLAAMIVPDDPGSPEALALARQVFAAATDDAQALSEAVRTGDAALAPQAVGRALLGYLSIAAGVAGTVVGNAALLIPPTVRSRAGALNHAAERNAALHEESVAAGRLPEYRELYVAANKRYWDTGDLADLTLKVGDAAKYMNELEIAVRRGDDGSTSVSPGKLKAMRLELDELKRDLVDGYGMVVVGDDGKYAVTADVAEARAARLDPARRAAAALGHGAGVLGKDEESVDRILAFAGKVGQPKFDRWLVQENAELLDGLSDEPARGLQFRPGAIPGTQVRSPKLPSGFVPGIEYFAEYKVQGYQARRVLSASDLVERLPTAAAEAKPMSVPVESVAVPLAKALREAYSAYGQARAAFGGDQNPQSARRTHFGTLFSALGPPASQASARFSWLFADPSREAAYARGLVEKELGADYPRVLEYLGFRAPSVAGAAAAPASATTGYESLLPPVDGAAPSGKPAKTVSSARNVGGNLRAIADSFPSR